MADDPKDRGPRDRARINTSQEHELRYWCGELDVSEDELRDAVRAVGPMVEDVRRHLRGLQRTG